ncbi:DEAD/DEAH box helicase [Candidatus Woesearchaeota archaeon]|nr:DEAD/DEAH box helicase [Candidatus Woesearchaeota archaeon]
MVTFADFGLKQELLRALDDLGFSEPTAIQEQAVPLVLAGEDVIGMSYTGSGKTAAFGVPLLHNVEDGYGLQVLILSPTRELAVQIAGELEKFGKYIVCNVATVYGGVAYEPQLRAMKEAHVLVATPGRLLDHLRQGNVDLSGIFSTVLDEADKMVEMGFIEDVEDILSYTPEDRQLLLFGATLAGEIERIKEQYMFEPKVAKATLHVDDDLLRQYYYNVRPHEKFSLLLHLLRKERTDQVMVFCSTRSTVELVSDNLSLQGVENVIIHGKMAQNSRLRAISRFNRGEVKVLVASAVAARGLDIKDVSHVFNYDVSQDPQEYVHRIGRTARAGESGKAITLLAPQDHDAFSLVFRNYGISPEELPCERFRRVPFRTGAARKNGSARRPRRRPTPRR